MNRISVTLVLFILLAGIASPVSDTSNQSLSDTQITEKNEPRVSFVTLSSDDDCKDRDDDGDCDFCFKDCKKKNDPSFGYACVVDSDPWEYCDSCKNRFSKYVMRK